MTETIFKFIAHLAVVVMGLTMAQSLVSSASWILVGMGVLIVFLLITFYVPRMYEMWDVLLKGKWGGLWMIIMLFSPLITMGYRYSRKLIQW